MLGAWKGNSANLAPSDPSGDVRLHSIDGQAHPRALPGHIVKAAFWVLLLRVVVPVACYKPKFVIVYLFTLLTIHTGPSDTRQTTNYFLHNINYSLTSHNSFCLRALPGILGCGHGALEWACQLMLCSITSPLLSLGATLSLFPFHASNTPLLFQCDCRYWEISKIGIKYALQFDGLPSDCLAFIH